MRCSQFRKSGKSNRAPRLQRKRWILGPVKCLMPALPPWKISEWQKRVDGLAGHPSRSPLVSSGSCAVLLVFFVVTFLFPSGDRVLALVGPRLLGLRVLDSLLAVSIGGGFRVLQACAGGLSSALPSSTSLRRRCADTRDPYHHRERNHYDQDLLHRLSSPISFPAIFLGPNSRAGWRIVACSQTEINGTNP